MGERESKFVYTQEQKAKMSAAALAEANAVASEAHGILTQEQIAQLSDEELTHRFVEIADRGLASIRLKVPMPGDWHGEWIADDPASIAEAQLKGFIIDDKFAPKYGLHSNGTGLPIVGDVIHMICPTRVKDAHDRAAKIRYDRVHGKRVDLPEEADFEANLRAAGIPNKHKGTAINTSSNVRVSQSQILAAVQGGAD